MESFECLFVGKQSNRTWFVDVQPELTPPRNKLSRLGKTNGVVTCHQWCEGMRVG